MAKRPRRSDGVLGTLRSYAEENGFELKEFSDVHTRLQDDFTSVDVWPTTGKYYVSRTSYHKQTTGLVERQGEKGELPFGANAITDFLDKLFFAADTLGEEKPMAEVSTLNDFDKLMADMPAVLRHHDDDQEYYLYLIKGAGGTYRADYSNHSGKPLLAAEAGTPTAAVKRLQKKVSKYIQKG